MRTPNPDLIVLNRAKLPEWARRDIATLPEIYDGILSAEDLAHLAHCAREREARDAAKLAEMLGSGSSSS